ncbi:LysR family transcriptional regulator [Verminephrobacter aporrectodeae subsp. tuberculatae]|uniref:TOBE domain-containing protein n=1 Tax=Verminephrobacter aporrectodeae TaxID=1110389 RepID=UPI0022384050|nr:TOBE domain-containing protein [Verminephrobacter aporrectodeae]MCW5258612.1 LysR family transcriptional regulator [Verminephrobacter aporrectodeae subsp. tuberculatae]
MRKPRLTDALDHGLSDKRIDILRGIGRSGSISQAARETGVSYRAAWQAIDTLTNLAGVPLVHRAVGGAGGGGATLTAHGVQLLELAGELDAAKALIQQRWRAASGAADASGATLFALRTSMRNQFAAAVLGVETAGPLSRVQLRVGDAAVLCARITRESVELLGLRPGLQVIALCKATSVRVTRPGAAPAAVPANQLRGQVAGVERGPQGDEVTLELPAGGRIIGFADARSGLRVRQQARADVEESAVVVALAG